MSDRVAIPVAWPSHESNVSVYCLFVQRFPLPNLRTLHPFKQQTERSLRRQLYFIYITRVTNTIALPCREQHSAAMRNEKWRPCIMTCISVLHHRFGRAVCILVGNAPREQEREMQFVA